MDNSRYSLAIPYIARYITIQPSTDTTAKANSDSPSDAPDGQHATKRRTLTAPTANGTPEEQHPAKRRR